MATVEAVPMVADRLHPVERQWRDLVWLRGIGSVLLGAGAPLSLWLLLDLFVNLPPAVRLLGLVTTLSLAMLQVWRRLVMPLWQGIEPADVATLLEQAEPRLQERLLTCLELEQADPPASRAGRLMQRQIRKEAFTLLDELDVSTALPSDRAQSTLGRGLLLVAVVIAPFAIWMSGYGLAWQRLSAPLGNWGWGRDLRIEAESGDRVVSRGSDASIQVTVTPRRGGVTIPDQLTLAWRASGDSAWDERRLPWSASDKAFVGTLPRLTTDTEFLVTAPAAESPRYAIRVVDPPRLVSLTAAVDPPAYTGETSQQSEVSAELQTVAGSRVRWRAVFDRAVAAVEVDWPKPQKPSANGPAVNSSQTLDFTLPRESMATSSPGHNELAVAQLTAEASGMFVIRWRSPEGFVVEEPPRRLVVIPDQPPQVRLEGPATVTVQPDERHRLQISASDDYGFTFAELHAELAPGERQVITLPRDPQGARQYDWPWIVDLQELGVKHGQAISLRVRVVDNCEVPAPQERWSDAQVIVVSTSAPAAETRELANQTQSAREDLKQLMRDFAEQRQELREVHQKTAAAAVRQKDAEQEERLQKLQARQEELTAAFEDWQASLPASGAWDDIQKSAQELRDDQLTKAQAELAEALKAEPRERIEAMSQALDELAAAQRALQQLDDDIRALGNLGDELGELAKLANRSERLAESLEQAANPATGENDAPVVDPAAAAAAEAEQLQQALEQLLAEQPELRDALAEFQRQQAAAASAQAEQLAQQQRDLADAMQQALNAAAPTANETDQAARFEQGTQLAEQARTLADSGEAFSELVAQSNAATPEARTAAAKAADQLQELAAAAQRANFPATNEAAVAAAGELADAQQSLPAGDAAAREAGSGLAQDLKQLSEALQQMTPTAETQRGALAAGQQQLQHATEQMAQQTAQSLPSASDPPADADTPTPAQQAAAALQAAEASMAAAQQSLQHGESGNAVQQAQSAAGQLDQAAQALATAAESDGSGSSLPAQAGAAIADAGSSLKAGQERLQAQAQSPPGQPGESGQPGQPMPGSSQPGQSLPGGASAVPQPAAGQPSNTSDPAKVGPPGNAPGLAASAAEFRTAADALRRAARSANGAAPSMAQRSRQQTPSSAAGGQEPNDAAGPSAPGSLAAAPVRLVPGTRRNWGRLGGSLKTDLLDGGPLATHPEYSRQIQRYFETIARQQPAAAPTASIVGEEMP